MKFHRPSQNAQEIAERMRILQREELAQCKTRVADLERQLAEAKQHIELLTRTLPCGHSYSDMEDGRGGCVFCKLAARLEAARRELNEPNRG